MILNTCNLNASYNHQQVLYNISFSMEEGEILCLLGTSGSGKTTLLRAIAGLQPPDSGSIHFQDQEITALAPHKRQFGMMFQDYALFPHKNVAENIAFGLQMQRLPKRQQQERIDEVLELVDLADYRDRKITELSGGQQQRVALARSLAPRPRMLLLDEPLGSLDRSLRDYLATELRAILKQLEMTTIFVTHDQSEAFSLADKVAILLDGEIAQLDKPENIYQYPSTREVATFLGFKNFLCRQEAEALFQCSAAELQGTSQKDAGEKQTLLLRPEGAVISKKSGSYPTFYGKIVAKSYLGAGYRIMITANGKPLFFDLPLSPPPPAAGEKAALVLRPETLVWLR